MNVREAADRLKRGEIVAFPTETVYGLGADAWNPTAISHLFTLKGRPADNPLIVHLSDPGQVADFAVDIPPEGKRLIDSCWPGPLTLVLKKRKGVLDLITAGLSTVGLRIPSHPLAKELIDLTGPLVAPSANRSGRPSPTMAEHVRFDFGYDFPVLDGGECDIGLESTVLDLSQEPYRILRPGYFTATELSKKAGCKIYSGMRDDEPVRSPGMKYTHYKPEARVVWLDSSSAFPPEETLFITHTDSFTSFPHTIHFSGRFEQMASRLYDLFRTADHRGLKTVAIEPLPDELSHPIIAALKNRIDKAIGKF